MATAKAYQLNGKRNAIAPVMSKSSVITKRSQGSNDSRNSSDYPLKPRRLTNRKPGVVSSINAIKSSIISERFEEVKKVSKTISMPVESNYLTRAKNQKMLN